MKTKHQGSDKQKYTFNIKTTLKLCINKKSKTGLKGGGGGGEVVKTAGV